ncbi:hypothetical protein COLSTE_01441 [Collinsella stercoris DSM 13279]|uniref:Uncharacterized protein n=1 Tax=Collinsella stercoris DSM 13279 TaxID=445975 RepID=B6GBI3_9ACTN|nr:hypothetical protein COLSTE_01441 [Collinsella stercoris DSM 13279]
MILLKKPIASSYESRVPWCTNPAFCYLESLRSAPAITTNQMSGAFGGA